ncbi:MAG TPA: CHASE2 domain-containing protein, partial [Gemmataceae bacterium]
MRFAFFRKSAWWGVLIGLACAGLCWGLARVAFFRGLEEWVLDGFFSLRGPRPTAAKVVVIGLDEPLLEEELGKPLVFVSPELAEVVRYAAACGATSVGIDLIVPENVSDWPAIDRPGAEGDARSFGAAVREAGNVVLAQWHV